MPTTGSIIQTERIVALNDNPVRSGGYVLYWMQASQRSEYNHALEYAILKANELRKPLIVFFGITDSFPEANQRHYRFMLEGLREVEASLRKRGIGMLIWHKSPELGVVELAEDAALVISDTGYLRIQREWRSYVAEHIEAPVVQVESDVIVPVQTASPKEEYSAATFRPKLNRVLRRFLVPLKESRPRIDSLNTGYESFDIADVEKSLSKLSIDRSVGMVGELRGGTREAKRQLDTFLRYKMRHYSKLRNDPTKDVLSKMSPYLHFGQISPLYIALRILGSRGLGKAAFLEELIVRRELSMNFVSYNRNYDSLGGLPTWAKGTLAKHGRDNREHVYSLEELERGATHDSYWNSAQLEMVLTGKMHGYMRMYWGKKILEWSESVDDAYKTALILNNKYELDGRDPNGFTGVAWCFGKHDHPWSERPVFGKVRYMNANGLKRKFDADRYVERIDRLVQHGE